MRELRRLTAKKIDGNLEDRYVQPKVETIQSLTGKTKEELLDIING